MGNTQSEEHQKQLFQQKITPYGGVLSNKNDILFDFSNSGIEFQTLSKISFQIDFLTNDIMGEDAIFFGGHVYVKIYINGECQHQLRILPNTPKHEKTVTIEANQRVKIIKVSEARYGIVCVRNILSLPIQSVPKDENKVKVEFIGASLVSGYGNDHEDNRQDHTDWQKTWCYHLCQQYNWEAMVHSYSCMGLVQDSSENREEQIIERRRRIVGYDKESKFDFSTFKASYVFMNIGTNDFGGVVKEDMKTEFLEKMKELIYELQENYGKNVKVCIVHGPIMTEPIRDVMKQIPDLFNDDLDTKKNISILSTYLSDKKEERDLYWGPCWHPTELGHKVMADQIIEQMKNLSI